MHRWADMSIRMIKFCGKSIALPVRLIFKSVLNDGVFQDDRERLTKVRNSRVMKSSYETKLLEMTSHFELLNRKPLQKLFFRVTNSTSLNIKLNLLTRRFNFYFSTFKLLTRSLKIKYFTLSY